MARKEKVLLMIFVTILLSTFFTTSHSFAGSLVAYWSFEEGSGKVLKDQSGTGNDGQVSNSCKWVAGKFGKGMEFNGVDSFVLVKDNASYSFGKGDSFSISLWINYESRNNDWQGVMQKMGGACYPFKVEVQSPDNNLYFAVYDGTNFPKAFVGAVNGDWHHFCAMRDSKSKKISAYLDGKLKEENPDTTTNEIASPSDLYIGARTPGNTIQYKGVLDEIAIYNRVLTQSEITQAANGSLPELSKAVEYSDKLATAWGNIKKTD